ncbi:hypothetical protein Ancab_022443 [Ancistrocladus abbreviatus]
MRSLGRSLHPARKLFKTLTTKLHKSKIIKKSKNRTSSSSSSSSSYYSTSASFKSKSNRLRYKNKKQPLYHPPAALRHRQYKQHLIKTQKQHHFPPPPPAGPPIYIDELFGSQEAALKNYPAPEQSGKAVVVEVFHRAGGEKKVIRREDEKEMVARGTDEGWRGSGAAGVSGVSEEDEVGKREEIEGDEAWESVLLASPLMKGIDKRAEEFIARFRAELKSQETIAGPSNL